MDRNVNDSKAMLRFRESFRGYNKDDVNAYIEQINMKFSRRESDLRAQLSEMQTKIPSSDDGETAALSAELDLLNGKLASANEENRRLTEELAKLRESAVSDTENEEKSKLYDSMSAQVGNILIVANSNADKILSDAKTEAEKIKAEAELEAEKIKLTAEEKMNAMLVKLDNKLKAVSESYLADYATLISESQSRFSELTDTIKNRSEKLLLAADTMGKDIEKQISEEYLKTEASANSDDQK